MAGTGCYGAPASAALLQHSPQARPGLRPWLARDGRPVAGGWGPHAGRSMLPGVNMSRRLQVELFAVSVWVVGTLKNQDAFQLSEA